MICGYLVNTGNGVRDQGSCSNVLNPCYCKTPFPVKSFIKNADKKKRLDNHPWDSPRIFEPREVWA